MSRIKDIETIEEELHGFPVTTIYVQTEQASKLLNRTVGGYITIGTKEMLSEHTKIEELGECLVEVLDRVLRPYYGGKLCVCGLGNRDCFADALGPEVIRSLPLKALSEIATEGSFRDVCSIQPGTALTNNINTEVIVKAVTKEIGADCLLLVDSLVSNEPSRLFQTIQISTSGGLNPYFAGQTVDWGTLGIPVISLGVPVSIPLSALVSDQDLHSGNEMFTSIKIQDVIIAAGRIIAYALLRVCWPLQPKAECFIWSGLTTNPVPYSLLMDEQQIAMEPFRRCGTSIAERKI